MSTFKDSTAESVTYSATDSTDSVTVTQTAVVTFTLGITSANSYSITHGTAGTFTVTTAGFTNTPTISVSTWSPNLPGCGITFTDQANGTAKLSVPSGCNGSAKGTFTTTITATSMNGTATQGFTLNIN